MLIRIARNRQVAFFLLAPLLTAALWLPAFRFPFVPRPQVPMPLYRLLEQFPVDHPMAATITAMFLIGLQALAFNYFVYKHQLLSKRSFLPALFFLVFASCSHGLLRFHAPLLANFFLLPALYLMFDTYRMDTAYSKVFYTGLLVSLASLVYFPALVFGLFFIVCLIILRPFIWREWIILLLGIAVPYVYAASYYYVTDQSAVFWQDMVAAPVVNRDFFLALPVEYYPLTAVVVLLLLATAGRLVAGSGAATLKTRKGISCLVWMSFFCLLAGIPAQDFAVAGFYFAIIPVSVFVSSIFLNARRTWLAEVFFGLLIVGIGAVYLPRMGFSW